LTVAIELIVAFLLPTAAGFAWLGGVRALRWAQERRLPASAEEPIERLSANLRRLRADLEATETRSDVPAKALRLRALRGAYLDTLATACQRLDVSPPPHGDQVPQAEIYRVEAALRQRGLDVRETTAHSSQLWRGGPRIAGTGTIVRRLQTGSPNWPCCC
jgi:hypothetical protein